MEGFLGFIAEWATAISAVLLVVAVILFIVTAAKALRIIRAHRKAAADEADAPGEELPPIIVTGKSVYPHSLPSDFGRSPGRQ